MTIKDEKSFNVMLKAISANGEKLATSIHLAGLFALAQVNEHGNSGFGERLIEAMGRKHDVKRVEKWLCNFGKFGMKDGKLVYRARRDINPETIDAFLKRATDTPYWDFTAQEHHAFKFDGLGMLMSLMNRHNTAVQKADAGLEVEIKNEGVLAEVQAIIDKYNKPVSAVPVATPA